MKQEVSVSELLSATGPGARVVGRKDRRVYGPAAIDGAGENSVSFCSKGGAEGRRMIEATNAKVVICRDDIGLSVSADADKTLILVSNPRLAFIQVLSRFFVAHAEPGAHPTAVIGNNVQVDDEAAIGANVVVGDGCRIGRRSVIEANVTIYPGTKIGERVVVHAGAVIGADGFGFERDGSGKWVNFPQIGGVTIEDDVEVGANTCIDRGALGDTVIGEGTKTDNLVHISHNAQVGKRCIIVASAFVGGSVVVGDDSWIGPESSVLQKLTIGKNALVGMGAVVLEDVPDDTVVAGVPARIIRKNV